MHDPTRILVVAAHPDDEVLGMGGTIGIHAKQLRHRVRVVSVTEGSAAQYPHDEALRRRRADAAQRAAAVLGVEAYTHQDLPDEGLDTVPQLLINQVVENEIDNFRPHVVYTVHPDVNSDHRAVFGAVTVATRPTPSQHVRQVLAYAPPSSIEWTPSQVAIFSPNWFVDIGDALALKLEAFACYDTETREHPHPRSERALRAHAEFFGSASGCEYAEPFALIRNVVRRTPAMV